MPSLNRDVIEALGYTGFVVDHFKAKTSPAAIVALLEADPVFMDKANAIGVKKLYPTDIHRCISDELARAASLMVGSADTEDASKAVIAAKERILSNLQIFATFEPLAVRAISLLETELDEFETLKHQVEQENLTLPAEKRKPLPQMPHQTYATVRRNILTLLEGVRTIRGDTQLQGILRANTINVNKGISQDELHEILFGVGGELGFNRSQVLQAYTTFLMKKKAHSKAMDTDAKVKDEGKWESRMPMVKSLEDRHGIGEPSAAPA